MQVKREQDWDVVDLRWTDDALPMGREPDGAIICYGPDNPLVHKLKKQNCPMVRICGHPFPSDDDVPDVVEDLKSCGRMAADHFAERGFRHVAYLGHTPLSNGKRMYESFAQQAQQHGIECHLYQLRPRPGIKDRHEREQLRLTEIGRWLLEMPKPLGLLTYKDDRAARTCVAAQQAGLSIPDDVAILGNRNNPVHCEMAPVTLSSIACTMEEMGRKAASILADMISGVPSPTNQTYIAPKGIVERQSTNVLAVGDKDIARAIRFLWDNLAQNIGVGEVANEVGLPRRTLTRRFRQSVGRSIVDELRRKRLQETKRLLLETNLTIADIAAKTGFRSESLLYRDFHSSFKMTPSEFRSTVMAQ
jgi:LacI family transcriptional regulator